MARQPDRRARATGRRGGFGERHAQIPIDVLESEAVRTLPHAAFKVLVLLAAQFSGKNNGTMAMTELYARRFGFKGRHTIYRSLAELAERGLIVQTRQGLKSKVHFALYALGWRAIHNRNGQPIEVAEPPTRTWETWKPAGFPTTGNDGKKLQTHHGESPLPAAGNDGPGSVPVSAPNSPKSFPTTGNTLRISERDERGAPRRTRASPPAAAPDDREAWQRARARAQACGFRDPLPDESLGRYSGCVVVHEVEVKADRERRA